MSAPTADQFLMGGGVLSAKFERIGDTVRGKITEEPEVRQQTDLNTGDLKFWPDGRPQNQLVVTIQTDLREDGDDDGKRRIYVKGKSMTESLRDAVRQAGAKGLEVGGTLAVKYVGDGEPTKKGFNPPKQYAAQYERPVARGQQDFFAQPQGGQQPGSFAPTSQFGNSGSEPPF